MTFREAYASGFKVGVMETKASGALKWMMKSHVVVELGFPVLCQSSQSAKSPYNTLHPCCCCCGILLLFSMHKNASSATTNSTYMSCSEPNCLSYGVPMDSHVVVSGSVPLCASVSGKRMAV